ncbi:hypothetical protein [Mesorhizobium sp. M0500]
MFFDEGAEIQDGSAQRDRLKLKRALLYSECGRILIGPRKLQGFLIIL